MEKHRFQVNKTTDGKRLDLAVAAQIPGLSNRRAKAIIDSGGAFVNGKRVRIASRTVRSGEVVEVEYDPSRFIQQKAEKIALHLADILFEDDQIIAINKPAGLLTQATKSEGSQHVVPLLEALLQGRDGHKPSTLQLAHRLDKETTGVLLLGKTKDAVELLMAAFKDRKVHKEYHALTYGLGKGAFTEKDHLSAINPKTGMVRAVKSGGKYAETHVKVIEAFPRFGLSLFCCAPLTGRSHQIRVHMANRGFPIVGDKVYGNEKQKPLPVELAQLAAQHHFLHCSQMTFPCDRSGQMKTIKAPYPLTWDRLLKLLRS